MSREFARQQQVDGNRLMIDDERKRGPEMVNPLDVSADLRVIFLLVTTANRRHSGKERWFTYCKGQ